MSRTTPYFILNVKFSIIFSIIFYVDLLENLVNAYRLDKTMIVSK